MRLLIKAMSGRLQAVFPIRVCKENMDSSRTLNSVWTMLPCCPDGCMLECWAVQNLLDADGRPDASLLIQMQTKDPTFAELEIAQNFPGTLKIAFLKLVTLKLVIIRSLEIISEYLKTLK
jgi:hypothetical protein